jgi:hypothetical protein
MHDTKSKDKKMTLKAAPGIEKGEQRPVSDVEWFVVLQPGDGELE